jgi:hypothetical protein
MTAITKRIGAAHDWKAEMEAKKAFLRELIDNDDLAGAALGLTRRVIAEGEDGLTPTQKFAFERDVLRKFVTQECRNGCDIPWPEQYEALLNGGFCFYCYYGMTNYRDE